MNAPNVADLELHIARVRIVLSGVALLSIYVDPTKPDLASWIPLVTGAFTIDPHTFAILALHLAYAIATYALVRRRIATARVSMIFAAIDTLFAVVVAVLTEGATSPALAFFAFAITAVGCRSGFRATVMATLSSVVLYTAVILFLERRAPELYIMRPAYLAVTGYVIGFLGQQRVNLETKIRALETAVERHSIARRLHDDYVQALAGVNLRLQGCRELLLEARADEALGELTELQGGVAREFDEVRAYIRCLADIQSAGPRRSVIRSGDTRFRIRADFVATGLAVERVLQIMLEGLRNTCRHAGAHSASIEARSSAGHIRVAIADDGVGFAAGATPPWSIASRAAEVGGVVNIIAGEHAGAHLEIAIPTTRHDDLHSPHPRG
jgi:signal transduction histidine kinase